MPIPLALSQQDATAIYQAAVSSAKESSPPRPSKSAGDKSELRDPFSPIAEIGLDFDTAPSSSTSSSKPGTARPRSARGRLVAVANTSASMLGCMRAGLRHVKLFHSQKRSCEQAPAAAMKCEWAAGGREQTGSSVSGESEVPDIAIEILSIHQALPSAGAQTVPPRTFSTGSGADLGSIALEMPLPEAQGLKLRKGQGCAGATSPATLSSFSIREKAPIATINTSEDCGPGPVHTAVGQPKPHRTPVLDGASSGRNVAMDLFHQLDKIDVQERNTSRKQGCAPARISSTNVPRPPSSQVVPADVALSVYVLSGASVLNKVTELAGLGGAYHVGVEIFCLEWSFGWSPHGSGVHNVYAGCSEGGTFKERIVLGHTPCTPHEVIGILEELREAWPGNSYNMIRRNCAHFSMEFVRRLRVAEFPDWVNSLATLIDWLTHWIDGGKEERRLSEGNASARQTAAPESPMDDGTAAAAKQVLASELEWTEAQLYMLERAADAERARRERIEKSKRSIRRVWM